MTDVPRDVGDVLRSLRAAGHEAYLVGGCVRDMLAGVPPHDYDIATSATPDEVQGIFADKSNAASACAVPRAVRYGTTLVITSARRAVEVTTFRGEGAYSDGRRPDSVVWETDIRRDLARRDFTIGAMALDADGGIIDPFGGRADMDKRIIRAVGEAGTRFREDALRMLRAVRFAAYGYTIEEDTWRAVLENAHHAAYLAPERTAWEVARTLASACPEKITLALEAGLLRRFTDCGHIADAGVLRTVPPPCRMAAFLYAVSGGTGAGGGEAADARPTEALARALRLDSGTVADCRVLDTYSVPGDAYGWKHIFCALGDERTLRFAAAQLDGGAALAAGNAVIASGEPRNLAMLAVGGAELAALGLRGEEIGATLRRAFDVVAKSPDKNHKTHLISNVCFT